MVDLNPILPVITLNISGLNTKWKIGFGRTNWENIICEEDVERKYANGQ